MSCCDLILALAMTLTLFVTQCIHPCLACSPSGLESKTIPEQVESAPLVLYGRVLRTMDIPHLNYGGESRAYTAEMVVYCSLKKPVDMVISAVLNITEAGFVPGHCFQTTLEAGKEYILLAYDNHGLMKPYQTANAGMEATASKIREVQSACGLEPQESVVSQQLLNAGKDPSSIMKACFDVPYQNTCESSNENDGDGSQDENIGNDADVTESPENNQGSENTPAGEPGNESNGGQKLKWSHIGMQLACCLLVYYMSFVK